MTGRNGESKVQALLAAWRSEPVDAALLGVEDQPQLRNVAKALRGVAQARERKRRFRRVAGALALAAGVLGVAVGGWVVGHEQARPLAQPPVAAALDAVAEVRLAESEGDLQVLDGAGQSLALGTSLRVGATLTTQNGAALLAFPSGAQAHALPLTQLRVRAAGADRQESLFLARGEIDVEVPRLTEPVEFSVQTPDALVVVHGTQFNVRVDPDAAAGAHTHVAVRRGLVSVQSGSELSWLRAGQEWPPAASPQAAEPAQLAPVEPTEPPAPTRRAQAVETRRDARATALRRHSRPDRHSLAAENRVFASAMAKHKRGDLSGALLEIEHLLARYPSSLLVQDARVERFRLLHGLGRVAEAAREARSYLGDYRDGYARDEARDIAMEQP
ncbi:MAG: FecR family protein [Deltaproteobacteria bacterium]